MNVRLEKVFLCIITFVNFRKFCLGKEKKGTK